jgi:hypothetical protein
VGQSGMDWAEGGDYSRAEPGRAGINLWSHTKILLSTSTVTPYEPLGSYTLTVSRMPFIKDVKLVS